MMVLMVPATMSSRLKLASLRLISLAMSLIMDRRAKPSDLISLPFDSLMKLCFHDEKQK